MNTLSPVRSRSRGKRQSWEVCSCSSQDGGTDGNPATTPNDMWLVRGLFQP